MKAIRQRNGVRKEFVMEANPPSRRIYVLAHPGDEDYCMEHYRLTHVVDKTAYYQFTKETPV